jgi:hypothetical protein
MKTRLSKRTHRSPVKHKKEPVSDNKSLFTQSFPIIGEVPIAFFIPECESKAKVKKLIEEHGGILINAYEPYMYQIKIDKENKKSDKFYMGDIYSSKMIYKSIERGKMITSLSSFKLGFNEHGIPHDRIKHSGYTFTEAAKILDIAEKGKNSGNPLLLQFWEKVEEKCLIPGRTKQGLRGAYRKFMKLNKEDVLRMILNDVKGRFSHHFQYPPCLKIDSSMEKTPSTQVSHTANNLSPVRADLLSDDDLKEEHINPEPSES